MPVASGSDTIVVVEDDPSIAGLLELNLRRAGYVVHVAADGEGGLDVIRARRPAVVILDIGLPGMDGLEVCRRIRASDEAVAVIFLTARREEIDRILGLELGADDYVTKPFSPRELVLRIKAILNRGAVQEGGKEKSSVLEQGCLKMDTNAFRAWVSDVEMQLTPIEFKILHTLLKVPNTVKTREQLLYDVWEDTATEVLDRTVDAHVKRLRSKMGKARDMIETVRGIGYRLEERTL